MTRKAFAFAAAALLTLCLTAPAMAQTKSFGDKWNSFSKEEKSIFLIGFASAARLICNDISTRGDKNANPEDVKKAAAGCFNAFAGFNMGSIENTMNEFYSDKRNVDIPFEGIYMLCLMKLGNVKYDDVLEKSRQYGAALKKSMVNEAKKK